LNGKLFTQILNYHWALPGLKKLEDWAQALSKGSASNDEAAT